MENLRHLYENMNGQGIISTAFNVIYNHHEFSCIFIIGITNHQLYITTPGQIPYTIYVSIDPNFNPPSMLAHEDYVALADYLGFTPNKENPFKPFSFFEEFDHHCPTDHHVSPTVADMAKVIGASRNIPDKNKIYFVCWRKNPNGSHVSDGNYLKTSSIVGEEVANNLRENNISSCWSDIPRDEHLNQLNQYFDLL
jgi:hypothetical protein